MHIFYHQHFSGTGPKHVSSQEKTFGTGISDEQSLSDTVIFLSHKSLQAIGAQHLPSQDSTVLLERVGILMQNEICSS